MVGAATTSAPDEHGPAEAASAVSEQLYARHSRMVTGLCRALLRDVGEAEDAAQQTFLSAHRALLNGAKPREPAAWLATIARNECWARISARMRKPLPVDAADDVTALADPVAEAIRRADLAALWGAIRALPEPQRQALLLRELGGLRYDELAAAIGVSEPAVESLLFRARRTLRAAYAAVVGGAWLEPLARLVAGGGAPVLATKAVAVGLGTAAVTSTAVVLPKAIDHPPRARQLPAKVHRAPALAAPAVHVPLEQPAPAPRMFVPPPQTHRVEQHAVAGAAERHGERRSGGDDSNGGSEPADAPAPSTSHEGSDASSDGGTETVPTAPTVEVAVVPSATTVEEPSHEGPGSGGGGHGSDDGPRHGGSSGSDD